MNTQQVVQFLELYNQLQNDFDREDCILVFGEAAGFEIWDRFEGNNHQFPLHQFGITEMTKLGEYLSSQIDLKSML